MVCLVFWGRSVLECQKVPLSTSFNLSPSSSTFLAFFPNSVSFTDSEGFGATMTRLSCGVLAPQQMAKTPPKKALGSSWSHSLLVFFGQMAFAAEKVLWRVLPTILCICLPNGCCFNFFFGGLRHLCFTFIFQSSAG